MIQTIALSARSHTPGNEKTSQRDIEWIRGATPGKFFLTSIEAELDTNIETGSDFQGSNSTCDRISVVYTATSQGSWNLLKPAQVKVLQAREPGLAELPPDIHVDSSTKGVRLNVDDCMRSDATPSGSRAL